MSLPKSIELPQVNLEAMDHLAGAMLRHLPKHLVIGLVGTLGAGKTTLVQAISRAASIDSANVTSPTFTLLQTHQGTITLHHLDAYRVADEDEFLELGVEELFEDDQAWTLIEWADRVQAVMPRETLWIEIQIADAGEVRTIRFTTNHPPISSALDSLVNDLRQPS